MKKTLLIAASLCYIFITFSQNSGNVKDVFTNKELPNITIKDLDGKNVNIHDYSTNGKITVISFWATWCAPCKKELNIIADLYEYWVEDYDMELVAISVDDAKNTAKVKTYANEQEWEFIMLLDENEDLKRAMSFQTVPYTVLIDQKGNIVYTHAGYVEGDEYILENKMQELRK